MKPQGHWSVGPKFRLPTRTLGVLAVITLGVMSAAPVLAEGSRDLYPASYPVAGFRANLDLQPGTLYVGQVQRNAFIYVRANAGEYIVLGSSNRVAPNAGDVLVYDPANFGARGNETPPATPDFTCAGGSTRPGVHFSGTGTGIIAARANELAGPNSANNSATVTDGYAPCAYQAPSSGIYGVRFLSNATGAAPSGSVATLAVSNSTVAAWEVAVRANATSIADIRGRAHTYAFLGFTAGNNRALFFTLNYVTSDGYRYRQTLRGLDPNGFALYANAAGFLDGGSPLYKDIRGNNAQVNTFPPGVTAQPPQYPIFFSDIGASAPWAAEVNAVLQALGIPLTPPPPQLSAVTFVGSQGSGQTVVNAGGVIGFSTLNTLTFQIVISRDGVDFDPGNPLNRAITGVALTGTHSAIWDGRDNSNTPFPIGSYPFRIVGRNGEAHFPIVDAEGNGSGGPSLVKLNGAIANDPRVYFDDRGYVTRGGTAVGTLNGALCGAPTPTPPTPDYSLIGVDSNAVDGSSRFYRFWPGAGNNNTDCFTTAGFGDAKALDLWTFELTPEIQQPIVVVGPTGVDVGTAVTVDAVAFPGQTVFGTFNFRNDGVADATGVTYTATLGTGANCPASAVFTTVPAGVTASYAACTITFTGMPTTLTPGQRLTFNFNYPAPAPGVVPINTQIAAANETPGALSPNTANAQTLIVIADVATTITVPATAAPGATVPGTITFANLAAATVTATGVTYAATIGTAGSCPSGVIFPTLPPGATATFNNISCAVTFGGLPSQLSAGQTLTLGFTYTAPASGTIPVTSAITTVTPEIATVNNNANGQTVVVITADLAIVKNGPASVLANAPIVYTLTVSNNGPQAANGATFADNVPAQISGVTASCGTPLGGAVCGAVNVAGNNVTGLVTTFPSGGSVVITINGTAPATAVMITNTATVSTPVGVTDSNPANNTSTVPTSVGLPVADLAIVKNGPVSVLANAPIVYTLTVSNNGPQAANGATFADNVPAQISGVTASCGTPLGGAVCGAVNVAGNNVTGLVTTFPSGGSVVITINGTAPATAVMITNTATVSTPVGVTDSNPANNTSTVPTTVGLQPADLSVIKLGPPSFVPGGPISYSLTIRNLGPGSANGAVLSDPLPASISGITGSCGTPLGGAVCGAVTIAGNTVSSTVTTLPNGGSVVVTISGTVAVGVGSIINTATITPPVGVTDPNPNNDTSSTPSAPQQAAIGVPASSTPGALLLIGMLAVLGLLTLALRRR